MYRVGKTSHSSSSLGLTTWPIQFFFCFITFSNTQDLFSRIESRTSSFVWPNKFLISSPPPHLKRFKPVHLLCPHNASYYTSTQQGRLISLSFIWRQNNILLFQNTNSHSKFTKAFQSENNLTLDSLTNNRKD